MYELVTKQLAENNPKYASSIPRVFLLLENAGIDEDKLRTMTTKEFEDFFLSCKPKSVRTLRAWIFTLRLYGKDFDCKHIQKELEALDRLGIVEKVQTEDSTRKFISFSEYLQFLHDIRENETYNQDYQVALIMAIFNGLWSSDGSIIENLRLEDVDGNIVTVRPNGQEPYEVEVEKSLAAMFPALADQNEWETENYRGHFVSPIYGKYPDSIFKIESRYDSTYKHTTYNKFRKLAKRYLPFQISPRNFYFSGLLHRCQLAMKQYGFRIEDALVTRDPIAKKIMERELTKLHYPFNPNFLNEIVGMHFSEIE